MSARMLGCVPTDVASTQKAPSIASATQDISEHRKAATVKAWILNLRQALSFRNDCISIFTWNPPHNSESSVWPRLTCSLWTCISFPVDINECERPSNCQRGQCINNMGSYHCECQAGYTLVGGKRCQGQLKSTCVFSLTKSKHALYILCFVSAINLTV